MTFHFPPFLIYLSSYKHNHGIFENNHHINIVFFSFLSTLKIGLYKNGQYNPIAMVEHSLSNSSISTVSLVALPSVEKWDVLELKIAASLLTPLTVIDGSTFSVVLLGKFMI